MSDLLHAVRLCDVSTDARELLKQLLREVLEEGVGQPAAVLGPEEVRAEYLGGASKTKFYEILQQNPDLKALSFMLGRRRLWRRVDLDRWVEGHRQRQGQTEHPKARQAADISVYSAPEGSGGQVNDREVGREGEVL